MSCSFICTGGRGTEKFIQEELKDKFNCEIVRQCEGKIFFDLDETEDCTELLKLRTVERLMVELGCFKTCRLPYGKGKGSLLNSLKRRLIKADKFAKGEEIVSGLHQSRVKTTNIEPPDKKIRLKEDDTNTNSKTFRISCKISGKMSRLLTPQDVNISVGKEIVRHTNWKVDLQQPMFEITVHIGDDLVVAGIPITSTPLSKRSHILHHGLRSTVASIMTGLAHIQKGDVVMDPLCGKSTIIIEAEKTHPDAMYVGVDINGDQLKFSCLNNQHACTNIHLIQANSLYLPIKDESIDKIICDAPFGQKYKIKEDTQLFYRRFISQINRILRPEGRVVLLTSSDLRQMVIGLLTSSEQPINDHLDPLIKGDFSDQQNINLNSEPISDDFSRQSSIDQPINGETSTIKPISDEFSKYSSGDRPVNNNFSDLNNQPTSEDVRKQSSCDQPIRYDMPTNQPVTGDCSSGQPISDDSCKYSLSEQPISREETLLSSEDSQPIKYDKSTEGQYSLNYIEDHYIKLGECHSYLIVAVKKLNNI